MNEFTTMITIKAYTLGYFLWLGLPPCDAALARSLFEDGLLVNKNWIARAVTNNKGIVIMVP